MRTENGESGWHSLACVFTETQTLKPNHCCALPFSVKYYYFTSTNNLPSFVTQNSNYLIYK